MKDALVSIIIPTYNRADLISEGLLSVVSQTYTNWECIIVDDGSTDCTYEVVREFIDRDSRFRYLTNRRTKGSQGARNTGVIESKGDWICFLDSDDNLLENSIKHRIEAWEKKQCSEIVALIYGDFQNSEFKTIDGSAYQWMIKNMALCSFSVMLVKKIVFNEYLLDERFPAWQDDDFVFEIATKYDVLHCGKVVALFAPNERKDSITKSKIKIIEGMSLMISKRKNILLRDGGIGRLMFWYLRLLTSKLELFVDTNLNEKYFLIMRNILNLCIWLMRKYLSNKFDVVYA
jgi:glycosyltransferase involved in cell wall biosynthesis